VFDSDLLEGVAYHDSSSVIGYDDHCTKCQGSDWFAVDDQVRGILE